MPGQRPNTRPPTHHTTVAAILLLVVTGLFPADPVHAAPKDGDSPTVAAQEWKAKADEKDQVAPMGPGAKTAADNANPLLIPLGSLEAKIETLEGPYSVVRASYSPDGQTLATYDVLSNVILWDAASGRKRATVEDTVKAFSPDWRTLVTDYDGVTLWDAASGGKRVTVKGGFAAFSPDGRTLVTDDYHNHSVIQWDTTSGGKRAAVKGRFAAFSPDGRTLATDDDDVTLWDAASGGKRVTLKGQFQAFSPSGQTLTTHYDDGVTLWDAASGEKRVTLKGQLQAFSPDGRTLVTEDHFVVTLWDTVSGGERATLKGEFQAFSPDWQMLVTDDDDGVTLWDVTSGGKRATMKGRVMSVSPDGRTLVTAKDVNNGPRVVLYKIWLKWLNPDDLHATEEDAAQALGQARDAEIAALHAPKGEFEPTQAYQARLAAANARKQALHKEYEGRIRKVEEDWRRDNAQRRAKLLPYSTTDITSLVYDADAGFFRAELNGQSVTIPVPLLQAKAIKEHAGACRVEGKLRYHDADHAELVDAYLVDTVENLRFPFGT